MRARSVNDMSAAEREAHEAELFDKINAGRDEVERIPVPEPPEPMDPVRSESKAARIAWEVAKAFRAGFIAGFVFLGYMGTGWYLVDSGHLDYNVLKSGIIMMAAASIGFMAYEGWK